MPTMGPGPWEGRSYFEDEHHDDWDDTSPIGHVIIAAITASITVVDMIADIGHRLTSMLSRDNQPEETKE